MAKGLTSQKNEVGEVLRLLRIINDLSIKQLSEKTGISPAYISSIEGGSKKASMQVIERYSEVLNVNKSTILYFDEERQKNNYSHKEMLLKILETLVER